LGGKTIMGISRLNWDEVKEARPAWSPQSGRLYAIWPSPVDHDQCFEAAGFSDFGDSDDTWDRDFADLVARLLDALAGMGKTVLREGEYPVDRGRTRVSCRDALIAAARDDNFPPCVVGFGDPPNASVRTGEGHAILWTWVAHDADVDRFLGELAGDREIVKKTMKWEKLA
jgi:hypothetical protein